MTNSTYAARHAQEVFKTALEKKKPQAELVATGCLLKLNPAVLIGNYTVLENEDIDEMDEIIAAQTKLSTIPDANYIYPMKDLISPRAFLVKKFFFYYFT